MGRDTGVLVFSIAAWGVTLLFVSFSNVAWGLTLLFVSLFMADETAQMVTVIFIEPTEAVSGG
jgi:hypothetical protein